MQPVVDALQHKLGPFPTWLLVLLSLLLLWAAIRLSVFDLVAAARASFRFVLRRSRPEDEEHVERRQAFADTVEGRIRDLDRRERWTYHRFAELEAEVETDTEGQAERRGILRRRRPGLRREPSLTSALKRNRAKIVLLQGDPGSGKSVAMRFVARRMAVEAMKSRRQDASIPLYVNLKRLEPECGAVDAEVIRKFVIDAITAGAPLGVAQFVEDEFDAGVEKGTWLFLLDSFDEIPALLRSVEVDETIDAYSSAIFRFASEMNRCRTVIASRQFRSPRKEGRVIFRIVPLSEPRKRGLIHRAQLGSLEGPLLAELRNAETGVAAMSSNPLFLGLLCETMRETGEIPRNSHEVFESYVQRRLDKDRHRVEERGLDVEELRWLAEELAFTMTIEGMGLSPTWESLLAAAERSGHGSGRAEVAMEVLEYVQLAQQSDRSGPPDRRTFTFAHRRFQEFFATCVVLREPQRVQPTRALLIDGSWRETTVTLFQAQTASTQLLRELHNFFDDLERSDPTLFAEDGDRPLAWPARTVHVLGMLQAGFAGHPDALPDGLRARVGALVEDAFRPGAGTLLEKKWMLEVAGPAPTEVLGEALRAAYRGSSDWLREVAYRQTARLPQVPDDLAGEIRRMLARRLGEGRLHRDWLTTKAELLRLRPCEPLMNAARLMWVAPVIDALSLLIAGLAVVAFTSEDRLVAMLGVAIAAVVVHLSFYPLVSALGGTRWLTDPSQVERLQLREVFKRLSSAL